MYRTAIIGGSKFVNITGEPIVLAGEDGQKIEHIIPTAGLLGRFIERGGNFESVDNTYYLILASDAESISEYLGQDVTARADIKIIKPSDDRQALVMPFVEFRDLIQKGDM